MLALLCLVFTQLSSDLDLGAQTQGRASFVHRARIVCVATARDKSGKLPENEHVIHQMPLCLMGTLDLRPIMRVFRILVLGCCTMA